MAQLPASVQTPRSFYQVTGELEAVVVGDVNAERGLTGCSQGAQVVYKGAALLSSDLASKIKAAVLFGNPDDGQAVPNIDNSNVKTYCHVGDLICAGEPIVLAQHLTYGIDAPSAASYIAGKVSV